MCHFKIYIILISTLWFGTHSELLNVNDTHTIKIINNSSEKFTKKTNCCTNGIYDRENNVCVGKNENYAFALPCRSFFHIEELEDDEDPESITNSCVAEYFDENGQIKKDFFICEEIDQCCTSGKFDPKKNTCVDIMQHTARYAFTLSCREFRPFEDPEAMQGLIRGDLEKTCVEQISSDGDSVAYFTCEKVDQELQITFEIWLFPTSIIFLIITLYIYMTELKDLRSPQDIAFMYAIFCLLLHMMLFMVRYTNENRNQWVTVLYNYAGRYFKTAYFSWFNIILISRLIENRNLTNYFPFSFNLRPIWNHFYGWTVPLIFIIFYMYYPTLNWHIPILILWCINVILLIMIICSVEYDRQFELLVWKRNHYRSWLLVRLFLGAGVLWVFGARYRIPIFTSLFALQGVLIFMLMVVYRYNAKRKLGGQKFGCVRLPKRWKKVPQIDEDDVPADVIYQDESEDEKFNIRIPID